MSKQFLGNDFSSNSKSIDKLSPDKVELAAELNMPLCMKVTTSYSFSSHSIETPVE